MKLYYDLHIHSALSPCSDDDMTPNNIVNMAYVKKLDLISVTDHNSMKNYPAIKKIAEKRNIKLIPGIEVTSKEEVHMLCYFRNYIEGKKFSEKIYDSLNKIENKPKIFGNQIVYDEYDEKISFEKYILTNTSKYSIEEIYRITERHGGMCIPAHINRLSNGIIGVLGFIPKILNFKFIEICNNNKKNIRSKYLDKFKILKNSDAHRLTEISERLNFIELDDLNSLF